MSQWRHVGVTDQSSDPKEHHQMGLKNGTRVSITLPDGFQETHVDGHTTVVDKPLAESIREYVSAGVHWRTAVQDARATETAAEERLNVSNAALQSHLNRHAGRLVVCDGVAYGDEDLMGNSIPGAPCVILVDEPSKMRCRCDNDATDEPDPDQDEPASEPEDDIDSSLYHLDEDEAETVAGTELLDDELVSAIRENIAANEAYEIAAKAEREADERETASLRNLVRLLRKYPGRVIAFNGRVFTHNDAVLGNSAPKGAPVVYLQEPASACRVNGKAHVVVS